MDLQGDSDTNLRIMFFGGFSTTGFDLIEKNVYALWVLGGKVQEIDSKLKLRTEQSLDMMTREEFKNCHSNSIDFSAKLSMDDFSLEFILTYSYKALQILR